MAHWFWGGLFAFLGGVVVGTVNYLISKKAAKQGAGRYTSVFAIRQILQIGYLVLIYLIAPHTIWNGVCLLVGGALGLTLTMVASSTLLLVHSAKDGANTGADDKEQGDG